MKLKCAICKKEFERNPSKANRYDFHFCSRECYGKAKHLRHDPNKKYEYSKKKKRYCLYCDRPFYVYEYEINRGGGKYCSQACYHNSRREKLSELK
jgi:hypothetical protein